MSWAKAQRILLIWPEEARILSRRLDLVMLQRRSQQLGAQLGLVCDDAEIRGFAAELKIPVFGSIQAAQRQPWRRGRRQKMQAESVQQPKFNREELLEISESKPKPIAPGSRWRWIFFCLGVIAVAALVSIFIPSATIILEPKTSLQTVNISLQVSPKFSQTSATGMLQAIETSVTVEGGAEIETSGRVSVAESPAKGIVEFRNLTGAAVKIPAGTIVLAKDKKSIKFATVSPIVVPAGIGQSKEVSVIAVSSGVEGNVAAGAIQAVEGEIGLLAAVRNPEALTGGSNQTVRGVSELDASTLREKILANLKISAAQQIESSLNNGETLILGSVDVKNVVSEKVTPTVGMPGDSVQMTLQVEYQAWKVRDSDLEAIILPLLDVDIAAGYEARNETLKINQVELSDTNMNGGTWKLAISRLNQAVISSDYAISMSAGQSPMAVKKTLDNAFQLAEPPVIALFPNWWPVLPVLPAKIEVNVQ